MNKRKQKAQSPLLHWWNELLFTRYFEYETALTLEELAENLQGLAHQHSGWIWGLLKTSAVTIHPNGKGLDFDIQSKRKRKWNIIAITSARAQGSAVVDSATGQTTVRGTVKLGRLLHLVLLFYLVYFAVILPALFRTEVGLYGVQVLLPILTPLLILGTMMGFYWWRMYTDRNDLVNLIQEASHKAKAKHAEKRLVDDDTDWGLDDALSAQSATRRR